MRINSNLLFCSFVCTDERPTEAYLHRQEDRIMNERLSHKDKELVAVGVAVAAGCIPCTQYHMNAVTTAGATKEEITRAVDAALCVKGSTMGIMRKVAYDALGVPTEEHAACGTGPTDRLTELVSIGAAVAVNCPTNFHKHVEAGRQVGVQEDEIQLVVGIAKMMRGKAMEKMDTAAAGVSVSAVPQTEGCCEATGAQTSAIQPQTMMSGCCGPTMNMPMNPQALQSMTKGPCG
jgi:AhpD family alkylhydroperoxidase